jgi:hypothetical protein
MRKMGIDRARAMKLVEFMRQQVIWLNDTYQVNVRWNHPLVVHMSIKRRDKEPIHDWRELQEIKNQLVGRDHEAVEIYPSEADLIDTSNQFHLWVFKDPKYRLPFGFHGERLVSTPEQASAIGAKQRPRAVQTRDGGDLPSSEAVGNDPASL